MTGAMRTPAPAGPGDRDDPAAQGQPAVPVDDPAQAHDASGDEKRGRIEPGGAGARRDVIERAHQDRLLREGGPADQGHGCRPRHPGFRESPDDPGQPPDSHVEHQGVGARQRLPVGSLCPLSGVEVARGDRDCRGVTPVGERDPGERGGAQRRGHSRNDLERDAGPPQGRGLLADPAEQGRVPPLQPHDAEPPAGPVDHQAVDRLPVGARAPPPLAGVDALGARRRQVQQLGGGQGVADDHVGAGQQIAPAGRDQPRIPRAGPHQVHRSCPTPSAPHGASGGGAGGPVRQAAAPRDSR